MSPSCIPHFTHHPAVLSRTEIPHFSSADFACSPCILHFTMLMWSMTTVTVNGTTFRPDHIVSLAERPECATHSHWHKPQHNDVRLRSLCSSDDKLSDLAVLWGPVQSSWSSFAVLQQSFAVFLEVLCSPMQRFVVLCGVQYYPTCISVRHLLSYFSTLNVTTGHNSHKCKYVSNVCETWRDHRPT